MGASFLIVATANCLRKSTLSLASTTSVNLPQSSRFVNCFPLLGAANAAPSTVADDFCSVPTLRSGKGCTRTSQGQPVRDHLQTSSMRSASLHANTNGSTRRSELTASKHTDPCTPCSVVATGNGTLTTPTLKQEVSCSGRNANPWERTKALSNMSTPQLTGCPSCKS